MNRGPERRIVLAVTAQMSLKLMAGFPEHLTSIGWEVHIVSDGANSYDYPPQIHRHNVRMHREPAPVKDLLALIGWLRLLHRIRPDVVVAGTPKAGLLGMVAARMIGVPVRVYLLRGLRLETETGIRAAILSAMERVSAAAATNVQSVSRSLRDEFVSRSLAPSSKVDVVAAGSSNGVNVNPVAQPIAREQLGFSERDLVVGFVGRITKDKGVDVLVRAVREVRQSGLRIKLLLVGPEEPTGYLGEILSHDEAADGSVHWAGPVADVTPYYGALDLLCLPTYREGFPNVVLESAVHAVPTIASDVTGCKDAIEHGRTGLLFTPGDAGALASSLQELIKNPRGIKRMGAAARQRVRLEYAREKVWAATSDYYADLLGRTREER